MNISSTIKTVKTIVTANSPVLLVGTAIAGVVTTGLLAAKGGYKARGIIDDERMRRVASPEPPFDTFLEYKKTFDEKVPELTLQEKVQLTWLCYAIPALTGTSTIAATIGVHTIHMKRHAAIAGLYAMATNKLDAYSDKAEEMLGAKKSQVLTNELAQKEVDKNPIIDNEVIITGHGAELCYDEWSGRYFLGSLAKIENAINEINRQLIDEGDANMNDFYDELGLGPIPIGQYGWSGSKISGKFGSTTSSDGRAAISIRFHETPKEDYGHRR